MQKMADQIMKMLEKNGYRQVVYCSECKYRNTHHCYMIYGLKATEDKDYCSKGDRK